MKKIISPVSNKGGVGKTGNCGMVIDTIREKNLGTIHVVESDLTIPDLGKAYSVAPYIVGCTFLDLSNSDGFVELIEIVESTPADYIVINNPAGSAENWITYGASVAQSLLELDATLTSLWCLGIERDSVEDMLAYYNVIVKDIPQSTLVPTLNLYMGRQEIYYIWNASNTRKTILDSNGGIELLFPATAKRIMIEMREKRRKWEDEDGLPVSHKFESRRFRKAAWSVLEPIL